MSFQFDTTPVHRELVLRLSFALSLVGGGSGGKAGGSWVGRSDATQHLPFLRGLLKFVWKINIEISIRV
jgi:hypothetical protein